ncbi:MAG: methyltransferase domain-containing protein [Chloroflexota bacterium]|nr:methyltransferase domain-containing protein [Chloroflexota bacterium]
MTDQIKPTLTKALWRIYQRPERPAAWTGGGTLPWHEPAFSERMLREHLDQAHGAASRVNAERLLQIEWLWDKLALQPGMNICDITCGPGLYAIELARRGCRVTGIDYSPAAVAYARTLAEQEGVADRCTFHEEDIRVLEMPPTQFDAALFLYGQLAVFPQSETQQLLAKSAQWLKPGGKLCVELLRQERIDKTSRSWWFTDNTGLWGDTPFLHLGERVWDDKAALALERFYIIHLESGALTEIHLCDQSYSIATMTDLLQEAGFATVVTYPRWGDLPLYDADEWVAYVAEKAVAGSR